MTIMLVVWPRMGIAENLKRLRAAADLSQAGLAKKAGVAQQLISQIEGGKNTSTKYLPQIARALGASVEEIDPQFGSLSGADDARSEQLAQIVEIHRKLAEHPEWQQYLLDQAREVESRVLRSTPPAKTQSEDD
jgi:transcriptional regulator with XRE-family HTH domain